MQILDSRRCGTDNIKQVEKATPPTIHGWPCCLRFTRNLGELRGASWLDVSQCVEPSHRCQNLARPPPKKVLTVACRWASGCCRPAQCHCWVLFSFRVACCRIRHSQIGKSIRQHQSRMEIFTHTTRNAGYNLLCQTCLTTSGGTLSSMRLFSVIQGSPKCYPATLCRRCHFESALAIQSFVTCDGISRQRHEKVYT